MNFPSQTFCNDINHGYRAAILKKSSLWLLPFYMAVATYSYYKKVRRTMRTAIVSYLLKCNRKSLLKNNFPVLKSQILELSLRRHEESEVSQKAIHLWKVAIDFAGNILDTDDKQFKERLKRL